MNNLFCQKCGEKISNDFGVTLSYCTSCGANVQMPPTEMKTASFGANASPKAKSSSPFLLTGVFAALFLLVLLSFGAYWFINQKLVNIPPDNGQTGSPGNEQSVPTPRSKTRSSISVSDITTIEFYRSTSTTRTASATQFLGNVNPDNFVTRDVSVSFSADGKAIKVTSETGTVNGAQVSATPQRYIAAITREQFATLAEAFAANDFTGEPDSKTSTSLPTKFTLTVKYSSGEKKFQTSNSGKDTPEAAAMLRAFQSLENQIVWKER